VVTSRGELTFVSESDAGHSSSQPEAVELVLIAELFVLGSKIAQPQ